MHETRTGGGRLIGACPRRGWGELLGRPAFLEDKNAYQKREGEKESEEGKKGKKKKGERQKGKQKSLSKKKC